jgi:hypothetical protein
VSFNAKAKRSRHSSRHAQDFDYVVGEWRSNVPQGLKPSKAAGLCGTAEAVPFVQRSFLSFSALAVAPNQQFAP